MSTWTPVSTQSTSWAPLAEDGTVWVDPRLPLILTESGIPFLTESGIFLATETVASNSTSAWVPL